VPAPSVLLSESLDSHTATHVPDPSAATSGAKLVAVPAAVPLSGAEAPKETVMNDTVREILRARPSRLKSPFVFPSETGETPVDARNYMRRTFLPALKAAKIEGLRWHDLRHTFASRLVMAGVDLRTVQELMGHKTVATTLRYSHLSPAHQLDAVQRLNRKPTDTATDTTPAAVRTAVAAGGEVLDFPREENGPPQTRTGDPLIKSFIRRSFLDIDRLRSSTLKPLWHKAQSAF